MAGRCPNETSSQQQSLRLPRQRDDGASVTATSVAPVSQLSVCRGVQSSQGLVRCGCVVFCEGSTVSGSVFKRCEALVTNTHVVEQLLADAGVASDVASQSSVGWHSSFYARHVNMYAITPARTHGCTWSVKVLPRLEMALVKLGWAYKSRLQG
eukprot:1192483-Amphidinium_carterae.1